MIDNIFHAIGNFYNTGNSINKVLATIISVLTFHKAFYYIIGALFTRKFKPAKTKHKYGICIAARNEKYVIGNLIDSINKQDYPKDKYTIFVVADNCTDDTATIARNKGAICYERFDNEHRTKGFALQYLFKQIEKDYKIESFEGFFIFDADNLLKSDYISKMNDAFDEGCKIITSFRNTKNFDENWISSTYALHWIRSSRSNHRPRSVLRLATNIQGTGFLFSNEIVKDGWKYTSLTEDRALTVDAVAQGYQITYQNEAEFFDEQPTSFKIAMTQRIRWAKGHLQAFVQTGPYLFLNIFLGKSYLKTKWNQNQKTKDKSFKGFLKRLLESIRHRFASFDTLSQLTPRAFIDLVRWLIFSVIIYGFYTYTNGINNTYLFLGNNYLVKFIRYFVPKKLYLKPGIYSLFIGMLIEILAKIINTISSYITNTLAAIYLFIIEHKRIKHIKLSKKILYIFTWPMFDLMGRIAMFIAVFKKVTWKPIPHESKITINDLN